MAGSSVRSMAACAPPAPGRRAQVGHRVHRVGGRAAVAEREERSPAGEAGPQGRGGGGKDRLRLPQRLLPERPHLGRLHQHRAAHVLHHRLEVALALGQERVEEARRSGVVHGTRIAALQQAAMVEEHVAQLPEHVVERLGQLLGHERVVRGRHEDPLRVQLLAREREAAEAARPGQRGRRLGAEGDQHVIGTGQQLHLAVERGRVAGEPDRGQRALAHDHRVDELHGHVAHVRASLVRRAHGHQPAAAREALGHPVAEPGDPLRLGLEEALVRLGAPRE